jgi:hypothetical protein
MATLPLKLDAPERNEVKPGGWLPNYSDKATGAFRILQLAEKVLKATSEILEKLGNAAAGNFKELAGKFAIAWTTMGVARIPKVTTDFMKSFGEARKSTGPAALWKYLEVTKSGCDAVATYCYAGSLFAGQPALKVAGDAWDLGNNTCGAVLESKTVSSANTLLTLAKKEIQSVQTEINQLGETGGDLLAAKRNQLGILGGVKNGLKLTKDASWLNLAKAISSIFGAVIGLSVLAFGGPVITALALTAVSIFGICCSMRSSYITDTSAFKPYKLSQLVAAHAIA